jgi:hypothetical protein
VLPLSPRQSGSPLQSGATIHAAFALRLRTRPLGKHSRGHLCVHFRYGPMACHHPKGDVVDRFQKFGFPPPCYPSYGASDFCPGGTHLPLNTPAFAGHTTRQADPAQPGLRLRHRLQKPAARGFRDPFHGSPRDPQVCCCLAYRETVAKSHLKNFRLPGVRGPYALHRTPDCDSEI